MIVGDGDSRDIALHPRSDLDDIGPNLTITGPGIVNVFLESLVGIPGHGGDQRQVDDPETEFLKKFHRHRPLYFYPECVHQQYVTCHQRLIFRSG